MAIIQDPEAPLSGRASALFEAHKEKVLRNTNSVFAVLMVAQWVFAVFVALVLSPKAWSGTTSTVHVHVWTAVILGALIGSLPLLMIKFRPLHPATRHVVIAGQMLWSALLIHLLGGRIETHFHVFGSLAFVAFYRDWKVLITATVVVSADHLLRGLWWPESVYGIANPEWWRFLEHAGWVVFEDAVLVMACFRGMEEMRQIAVRQAALEDSQEAQTRAEKLAAVGQLAASVGHELRNPLAAIKNAHTYIGKKLAASEQNDPRMAQFTEIVDRELNVCSKIIGDLLDFARERPPARGPCPLHPLVVEALGVVPKRANVEVVNGVSESLPIPSLDREQFRQVFVNLVQNAVESVPADRKGTVRVEGLGGGERPWTIKITDDGDGIPPEIVSKIFQPLFTTKTKGTGLGLAIVSSMVQRHNGTMTVESVVGKGTSFIITLPPEEPQRKAA